jgi:hypothetical protein
MLAVALVMWAAGRSGGAEAERPRAWIDGTGPGWRDLGAADFEPANCDPGTWTWTGNAVACTGKPVGVIRSRQVVRNLELSFEWRHLTAAGNSGVFLWTPPETLEGLAPGGLPGGINFDAKTRRNSTDPEDIFYAHIGGMDAFARALLAAHQILEHSPYRRWREARYQSFDAEQGKAFESGRLTLEALAQIAAAAEEPKPASGRQELFENLINQYL